MNEDKGSSMRQVLLWNCVNVLFSMFVNFLFKDGCSNTPSLTEMGDIKR